MSAHSTVALSARWFYRSLLLCVLIHALPMPLLSIAVAEQPADDLFQRQLAAGEFGPALATVSKLEDAAARDTLFTQVAEAQAKSGGREEAFRTLAAISDDRVRHSAIETTKRISRPAGGGSQADFDSLIDLIVSTVKPQTWDEVGGPGSVSPFQNGVYVDAAGVLRRALVEKKASGLASARLAALRVGDNADPRLRSSLRKVSLTRLEKHLQLGLAAGVRPNDEMLHLAGLEKIQFVLVYPETGDLVLAGPAGSWRTDDEGRAVSRHTGRPVLKLDDLIVLLRAYAQSPQTTLTCSIDPTQQGLANTKAFAAETATRPLKPSERAAWLKGLRDRMGRQTISIGGIDPRTRVAKTLVEADYHMKLIGMGLAPGIVEVPSYLDMLQVKPGQAPPPLDVLRWWFTLKYDAVQATPQHDAFEIRGAGVQLLSENELLTQLGQRVHTGQSNVTNQAFANNFTAHFSTLAAKYPIYADLQNIFDLALVSALIQREQLADRVNWHLTCFSDPSQYEVELGIAPSSVETVINHRRIGGKHLVVGVSGGVRAEPSRYVQTVSVEKGGEGSLEKRRERWAGGDLPLEAWWWD
jgi:hypothetical protein